jgi:predicted HicB family RNase H-like nuclease
MIEAKPFASLSSGLLARKGTAKPAMRPQGMGQFGSSIEDLGWNDMGTPAPVRLQAAPVREEPVEEHVPSPISALTPMGDTGEEPQAFEPAPPIVEQQRAAIAASFAEPVEERSVLSTKAKKLEPEATEEDEDEPAPVMETPKAEAGARAKAAFTLRLEAERHLKLRLACAVTGRSAQQLVTEALDQLLEARPEIGALAEQVPGNARKPV